MRRLLRWYGANPLHLLTLLGSFALAGYAAVQLAAGWTSSASPSGSSPPSSATTCS